MPSFTRPQQRASLPGLCATENMSCLAVILRDRDREVLLEPDGGSFTIPVFDLPRRQRVAPHLLRAVEKLYGLAANCRFSFSLPVGESGQVGESGGRCVVLEALRIPTSDSTRAWVATREIRWDSIRPEIAREALSRALEKTMAYNEGLLTGRFVQPGWFQEIQDWVCRSVSPACMDPRGQWLQLNMGPDFSLISFDADGRDVWFKAVDLAGIREFTIVRELAALELPHLAPLLAAREEWRAWLMLGCRGCPLDQDATHPQWICVARGLAELQIASISHSRALIEAGCLDLRAPVLEEAIEPFLNSVASLFARQTTEAPRRLNRADLKLLAGQVKASCWQLRQLDVPDTLGHSDLNPGNVLVDDTQVVFLDWMQGHIGNPLLSFEFLLALCRRLLPGDDTLVTALRREYLCRWQSQFPDRDLERCSALVPLLAPFAFALNFRSPTGWQEERPEVAALLRSLARRMYVEAERLVLGSMSRGDRN
jgi:hypothetical protein